MKSKQYSRSFRTLNLVSLFSVLVACTQVTEPSLISEHDEVGITSTPAISPYPYPAPVYTRTPYPYPAGIRPIVPSRTPWTPEPTPAITPEIDRIVTGFGNFPLMYIVAPTEYGGRATLYRVEGNTAAQIANFGDRFIDNLRDSRLSPDGQYLGVLFIDTYYDGGSYLQAVNLFTGEVSTLVEAKMDQYSNKETSDQYPAPTETSPDKYSDLQHKNQTSDCLSITSFLWLENEQILYSRVCGFPALDEAVPGELTKIKGEVWSIDLMDKEQEFIVSSQLYRLLGVSKDKQTYYVSGLVEIPWNLEDLFYLDPDSGVMESV